MTIFSENYEQVRWSPRQTPSETEPPGVKR